MVILGKAAGTFLGKRYITGKIDKDEFDNVFKDIMPDEYITEIQKVQAEIEEQVEELKKFIDSNIYKEGCVQCGSLSKFLRPLKEVEGMKLCSKCRQILKYCLAYSGYTSNYIIVESYVYTVKEMTAEKVNSYVSINSSRL